VSLLESSLLSPGVDEAAVGVCGWPSASEVAAGADDLGVVEPRRVTSWLACFDVLGLCGTIGTTGTIGTAGLEFLDRDCVDCALLVLCGRAADEGVVGCVESVSEGAWEVVGVWGSDGTAVEVCSGAWGVGDVFDSSVASRFFWLSLAGSWTAAAEFSRARGFRRRRGILAGNGASGTDNQGSLKKKTC
jgi:hypothetical protein